MSTKKYKMPRKWDKEHCESKPCDEMGFSEKASCRPYVDCYGDKTGSNRQDMISKLGGLIRVNKDDFETAKDALKFLYNDLFVLGEDLEKIQSLYGDYPKDFVNEWSLSFKDTSLNLVKKILKGHFNNPRPQYKFPKLAVQKIRNRDPLEYDDREISDHANYLLKFVPNSSSIRYELEYLTGFKNLSSWEIDSSRYYNALETISKVESFFSIVTNYVNRIKHLTTRKALPVRHSWSIERDYSDSMSSVVIPSHLLQDFEYDLEIRTSFLKRGDKMTHGSHFRRGNGSSVITIYLSSDFKRGLLTLHHEMIHALQHEIGGGLPTKKQKSTGFNQNLLSRSEFDQYLLDDQEFYTKLSDVIVREIPPYVKRNKSISALNKDIKLLVKYSVFFHELKKYGDSPQGDDRLRWKKAVKILTEEAHKAFQRKLQGETIEDIFSLPYRIDKQASSKAKLRYLGSESGIMPYDFYFMRVENDYYYHYTYRDRAEEIIEDGFLRPRFYKDQPGADGVYAISGSYGQEVTRLQVSGSRQDHMDKIVALKFKTRTEPKYGFPEEVIWDKPVKLINPKIVSVSEVISDLRKNEDLGEELKVFYDFKEAIEIKKKYGQSSRVASRYLESAKRDDSKLKNTGHGGLDTWFAGHGGGKPDERATWGDWIAITPIKHTIKKEDGEDKTYEAGDIVGPCAVSSEPSWESVTDGGKNPLKCMPRDKAHDLTKEQRATLARKKRREESKAKDGQKPVHTPTFSEEGKEMIEKKASMQHKVKFEPTGNNKLDIALALAHSKKQGFISLLGYDVYEDIITGILADAHAMLYTRKLDVSKYNIRPYNRSIFQWKKDYEQLNVQQSRYRAGNAHIWGDAPQIWVEAATLGAELKVEMEGTNPSIKGELKIYFPITYTILKDRGPHPYEKIKKEGTKFYTSIPIEINLRNSDTFNRLYLSWLEGQFD